MNNEKLKITVDESIGSNKLFTGIKTIKVYQEPYAGSARMVM
ncbi:hypothetical protein [Clostridium estertheticum]|nr:hypothetical protein [Clostridium estertheticum]